MILTHCGKLGDFLYCLPVAEWLYREKGEKTHWALPRHFEPFNYIENLLLLQPHCERVTLVDYKIENWGHGGQPYQFNPAEFGVEGEYRNLGFRSYPNEYIPAFYAKEHGFGHVANYRLEICDGTPCEETNEVLRSRESPLDEPVSFADKIPEFVDLLQLVRRIAAAKEFHTWYSGLAVLAWMAGIPQHVYRQNGHANNRFYFPEDRGITWHHV